MDKVVDSVNNSSHAGKNYDYGELDEQPGSCMALSSILDCGI